MIRVGKNESRYLKSIDKYMDLRTRAGKGFCLFHRKESNLDQPGGWYTLQGDKRDDGIVTKMPITPSITLFLNGHVSDN